MKLCSFILTAFLILSLSNCEDAKPKTFGQAHIYLATKFSGHQVSIDIDEDTLFAGRVLTDESSGLAATMVAKPPASSFKLQIKVASPATGSLTISEAVDLSKGAYFTIFLAGKDLHIQQEMQRPDFY